jgi:hypothetical protein
MQNQVLNLIKNEAVATIQLRCTRI